MPLVVSLLAIFDDEKCRKQKPSTTRSVVDLT